MLNKTSFYITSKLQANLEHGYPTCYDFFLRAHFMYGASENMLGKLSSDIICSEKFTVFLELLSRKTVRFSEQITSVHIFPLQLKAIV